MNNPKAAEIIEIINGSKFIIKKITAIKTIIDIMLARKSLNRLKAPCNK